MASYRKPAVAKANRDSIYYKRPFFMCNIKKEIHNMIYSYQPNFKT